MPFLLSYGEILVDVPPSSAHRPSYFALAGGALANVAVAYSKLDGTSFSGSVSKPAAIIFRTSSSAHFF